MTTSYTMNFDGCSKSNPGPSGAGAVIYQDDIEIWCKAVYVGDKATNNVAEYSGLIIGLEEANNMEISNLIVKVVLIRTIAKNKYSKSIYHNNNIILMLFYYIK